MLVVPIGPDTDTAAVAQRLATMSALRGENVVLADFQPEGRIPLLTAATREGKVGGGAGDERGSYRSCSAYRHGSHHLG